MDKVKKKLVIEIISDIVFVIAIVIFTIYGVIHTFPALKGVKVETLEDHYCPTAFNCVCDNKKCTCEYCNDGGQCLIRQQIECDSSIINNQKFNA